MEAAAPTREARLACAHCGLPVTPLASRDADAVYCCHACRVVALILGKQQGEHNWTLLRFGFGTLLVMNVMMLSLLLYTGSVEAAMIPTFRLVLLGLATPALAILLPPFVAGALRECLAGKMSLDALIACGSLAAFSVSAVNALRGAGAIYFDTATMLPVLVTFGKIIEASAKSRAADLLHALETLLPPTALRVAPAGTAEVGIETLRAGDLVRVRPGERIPVDGRIREGTSSIAEASFTGEFLPRLCNPGDDVIAGTVNGTGSLLVQAERTGAELLLHGIISMIDAAWRKPSQAERIAQRAAELFIPALLVLATGSLLCWWLLGNLGQGLLSALSVLVVACPCTMGIATPLATSLAIARAARAGIVVRGGSVMEQIARTGVIFFDKTGTITMGRPALQEIQIVDRSLEPGELLGRLAALEAAGGHVLGKVVVEEASRRGCEAGSVSQVRVHPGMGMSGAVTWRGATKQLLSGSAAFVGSMLHDAAPAEGTGIGQGPALHTAPDPTGADLPQRKSPLPCKGRDGVTAVKPAIPSGLSSPSPSAGEGWGEGESAIIGEVVNVTLPPAPSGQGRGSLGLLAGRDGVGMTPDDGHTVMEVAWDGELRGRLLFSDVIRPEARSCIAALGNYGISSVLLSGDRLPTASSVASRVGIARVEAPRTPARKLQAITERIAAGSSVAMVGDGINDAPALAAAHTGIAFGAGTDLARQAGNVVILSGRLTQVPWLIGLSRQTGNIIRGNFAWSFGYNAIALGAAAGGLLHPLLAALAMVVSSLTVLGNSLRITGYPDDQGPSQSGH